MPEIRFSPAAPKTAHRSESTALALSALAAIFWGTNFEATRVVLVDTPPWTAAALRFVIAALAIMVWLRASRGFSFNALKRNLVAFIVLGVIGVAGFNAALFIGMKTSSPVTAALIMGTSPLTTNLLEALFSRRLPAIKAVVGMIISLFGVALTVGAFSGAHFASGDLLILAGSLAWALYTIGCRRLVHNASPIETSAWTVLFGAVALCLAAFVFESPLAVISQASLASSLAILWMALIGSVLAYIFWQIGIARRGPAATSVVFNLVPVSALAVAAIFGRVPDVGQIAGVAIAISGILLASGRLRLPGRIGSTASV